MKKYISTLLTILFLASIGTTSFARGNEPQAEKSKTYSKSYSLGSNDQVNLNNQFGEMKITTWNKNEIKVDVNIVAKANTDEAAQKILDNITIDDGKNANEVYFKTNLHKMSNNSGSNKKGEYKEQGMKIDYVVYMPATAQLNATNQFGPMIIPDFRGVVVLVSKFGSLTAGHLSQVKEVNVEFGEAWIDALNGGKLIVKFSKGNIKSLSGNVEARFEFCDKMKVNVDNNVKDLNIRSSYSNLYVNATTNLSSAINIKTSFGDFTNKTGFDIKKQGSDDEKYGPKFDKLYIGNAGSGTNRMKINADFGDVILGHDLEVDFKSKKKQAKI